MYCGRSRVPRSDFYILIDTKRRHVTGWPRYIVLPEYRTSCCTHAAGLVFFTPQHNDKLITRFKTNNSGTCLFYFFIIFSIEYYRLYPDIIGVPSPFLGCLRYCRELRFVARDFPYWTIRTTTTTCLDQSRPNPSQVVQCSRLSFSFFSIVGRRTFFLIDINLCDDIFRTPNTVSVTPAVM